jgi:hypothetical protein
MRYMLLIYTNEKAGDQMTPEEAQRIMDGHWAVIEETRKRGILEAAKPLQRAKTATTVRLQNGQPIVTDGPFAETKEQLAGYYILDCELDEALAWAAKIPTECGGATGCVEIRPIMGLPRPVEASALAPAHNNV